MLSALAIESAGVDPECSGGRVKARGLVDDSADVLDFELVERVRATRRNRSQPIARSLEASLSNPIWEVGQADLDALGEDRRAFDRVTKLSKISGPGVTFQGVHGFGGETRELASGLAREKVEQVRCHLRHVGTRPKRRQGELNDVEPVHQVFAKGPGFHGSFEVAICRGDDSNDGGAGLSFSYALIFALLEKSQELGLKGQRKVTDLVEEQSSPFGCGDLAGDISHGTREGAPDMAEEVALKELRAQAGTTHREERPIGVPAPSMESMGEDPFAGAVFAPDQYTGFTLGHPPGHLENARDFGVSTFQIDLGDLAANAVFKVGHAVTQASNARDALDDSADLCRREGLGKVVKRSATHGVNRSVDRRMGGDQDHREPRLLGDQGLDEIEAGLVSEAEVDQGEVAWSLFHDEKGGGDGGGFHDRVTRGLQGDPKGVANVWLVVDD